MTPTTLAATLAKHFPALPPPIEHADGGVWYKLSAYVGLTITPGPDDYVAHIASGRSLGLACDQVASVATTPEAAVADAIRKGDHILAAAALAAADQAHTLAALLGASLPTTLSSAQERVDHTRRVWNALRNATEAAEAAYKAAQSAKQHAGAMYIVEAALPGLTGPAHAGRVAFLRKLAPSGWHKVNGNHTRWLQNAGLVDAHKVITARDRHNRLTAQYTEASITEAGRLALRTIDAAKGATP